MHQNSTIPGVVDGTIAPSVDADGNVSFHIVIRDIGRSSEEADYVEVVLTHQDAEALMSMAGAAAPVPCSVGVRLNSAPSYVPSL
ncbi:hypothetical protein [Streptomyces wuyuanensis]|uniref:hypothetical protein n=1 Tax=Streptomyces wuyuanensis TaxID=1196353 RepID=UPI0034302D10